MTDAAEVDQNENGEPIDDQALDAEIQAAEIQADEIQAAEDGAGQFEPATLQPSALVASPPPTSMTLLHDVDMEVTVELGRTTMPIRDLLALQPGMVVEIEREAGAPIDVLVNGRLIACGEVVVIDEEFGIRITEIAASGQSH